MNIDYMEGRIEEIKQKWNKLVDLLKEEKDPQVIDSYKAAVRNYWHEIQYYEFNIEIVKMETQICVQARVMV
jgi:hypothetical protein